MIRFKSVSKKYSLSKSNRTLKEILTFRKSIHSTDHIFTAINNVSFDIDSGTTVSILGSNGAGKSTLLKLLTSITLPSSGTIEVSGNISSLMEASAGFHPDLTGYENIFLSGAILGMKRKEIIRMLPRILDFSEIGGFIHEPVKSYSSGMLVRLAFAIGSHLDTEILVVDEALAVGDSKFREKCFERIDTIKKQGCTILFVSHDIEQVRQISDRCLVLKSGELIYDGSVEIAIEHYNNILFGG